MNNVFHVFSEGKNVLFRDDSDYIFFNNKFASLIFFNRLQVLAETTMSTHFHCLIETPDKSLVNKFAAMLHKSYSIYYMNKYGGSLKGLFKIYSLEISGVNAVRNELTYIMKNPVHHYVTAFPFQYKYSSASYLFADKFYSPDFMDAFNSKVIKVKDLPVRQKKESAISEFVPPDWFVLENKMIVPLSYINIPRAQSFWNTNIKSFMFDIIKNSNDANQNVISADLLDLRINSMSDTDVCKLIDDYCTLSGYKSFHYLGEEGKNLVDMLKHNCIPDKQIGRCLWKDNL